MQVGVPKEIKSNENRVALTPAGAHSLASHGHQVVVESGAGLGSFIPDEEYVKAGAKVVPTPEQVWADSELILKVKEPIACEYELMVPGQILFTYLHLAADKTLTEKLLEHKICALAYETVQKSDGTLPLLAPMSEIAGRLSAQIAANYLLVGNGGRGILLGATTGTRKGKVTVLGGGVAGYAAAKVAHGMGASVTVFDINLDRMRYIEDASLGQIQTEYSTDLAVTESLLQADAVIGSVLIPGGRTPQLVTNELVAKMKPGSVLVDIAIDQGGCFADSHPTTHDNPVFKVHNSIFYCVGNMPGAVPTTATNALTNSTLSYCLALADNGWKQASQKRPELARGLMTFDGKLYSQPVASAHGLKSHPVEEIPGLE